MPGCVLHVTGSQFDPDEFLATSQFRAYGVWRAGEPMWATGSRSNRRHEWSGFSCDVSTVNGDLRGQVKDALEFITQYYAEFEKLAGDHRVEDCRLDFGITCRLGRNRIAMQGEFLPVSFLRLVGAFGIAVAISIYPPLSEEAAPVC